MDRFLKSSIPQARRGTAIMNQIFENSTAQEAILGATAQTNPHTSSGKRPAHRLKSMMNKNSPQIQPCPNLGIFPMVQDKLDLRKQVR